MTIDQEKLLKEAIKILMKRKQISYSDLAEHLNLSLPSVKRILNQEELNLGRLLAICKLIGISLSELETFAYQVIDAQQKSLSEDQELFLATDIRFLSYFILLYEHTPEQIAKRYELNKISEDKYLIELEKNNLIQLRPNGSVKLLFPKLPTWRKRGPIVLTYSRKLLKAYHKVFEEQLEKKHLQNLKKGVSEDTVSVRVIQGGLTKESWEHWRKKYLDLLEEFQRISDFEEKFAKPSERKEVVLLASNLMFSSKSEVEKVFDLSFGGVTNLF